MRRSPLPGRAAQRDCGTMLEFGRVILAGALSAALIAVPVRLAAGAR